MFRTIEEKYSCDDNRLVYKSSFFMMIFKKQGWYVKSERSNDAGPFATKEEARQVMFYDTYYG